MPKVSVIIPVYNVEKYLGECLDSILGQTLKDVEVLCVDDASTDSSLRILEDYAAKDSRVKVLRAEHGGAFKARKIGIEAAKGEYIYLMDSDDLLESCAFAELCERADRDKLDQVVFASSVFCEDDVPPSSRKWAKGLVRYYTVPKTLRGKVMSGMELMEALLSLDQFHVSPPLRIIRASVLQKNHYGFPDAQSRADNYFTPISLYYSKRACAVNDKYYRRRVRNESITTANGAEKRHFRNMFNVLLELYRFEPFRSGMLDPSSSLARFTMKLLSSLNQWVWKIPLEERTEFLREVSKSASIDETAFLLNGFLMTMREFKLRPKPTLTDASMFVLRLLWRMLRGKRKTGWFLR